MPLPVPDAAGGSQPTVMQSEVVKLKLDMEGGRN